MIYINKSVQNLKDVICLGTTIKNIAEAEQYIKKFESHVNSNLNYERYQDCFKDLKRLKRDYLIKTGAEYKAPEDEIIKSIIELSNIIAKANMMNHFEYDFEEDQKPVKNIQDALLVMIMEGAEAHSSPSQPFDFEISEVYDTLKKLIK